MRACMHAYIYITCMRMRAGIYRKLGDLQEQLTEEKPTPTKNKRSGSKRLSTLERTAQEGEAILKVRLAENHAII